MSVTDLDSLMLSQNHY